MKVRVAFASLALIPGAVTYSQVDRERAAGDFAKFGVPCSPKDVEIRNGGTIAAFGLVEIIYRNGKIAVYSDRRPGRAVGPRKTPDELLTRMVAVVKSAAPDVVVGKTRYELTGPVGFTGYYTPKHGEHYVHGEYSFDINAKSGKPVSGQIFDAVKYSDAPILITERRAGELARAELGVRLAESVYSQEREMLVECDTQIVRGLRPRILWSKSPRHDALQLSYVYDFPFGAMSIDANDGLINLVNLSAHRSYGRRPVTTYPPPGFYSLPPHIAFITIGGTLAFGIVVVASARRKPKASKTQ